jgi:hypothetical protein
MQERFGLVDEYQGGNGKINLPAFMRPGMNPADEWYSVEGLALGDDEIRGRVSMSPFFKPAFSIDRHTGSMELSGGSLSFSGLCQPYDDDPSKRLF